MQLNDVIEALNELGNATYREGMVRFGISNSKAIGVKLPDLRKLARMIKRNHQLALSLGDTGIHEARILATMIADPEQLTSQQMDAWVNDFDSWDVCDQACGNLFDKTDFWIEKAFEYSESEREFVKRAGFVLMAEAAVHLKKLDDSVFIQFLPVIEHEACDNRNFVKKAVNWALRQIGKRNATIHAEAMATAERIAKQDSKSAKWIAADAIRELSAKQLLSSRH